MVHYLVDIFFCRNPSICKQVARWLVETQPFRAKEICTCKKKRDAFTVWQGYYCGVYKSFGLSRLNAQRALLWKIAGAIFSTIFFVLAPVSLWHYEPRNVYTQRHGRCGTKPVLLAMGGRGAYRDSWDVWCKRRVRDWKFTRAVYDKRKRSPEIFCFRLVVNTIQLHSPDFVFPLPPQGGHLSKRVPPNLPSVGLNWDSFFGRSQSLR